jgi:hypothetical protein
MQEFELVDRIEDVETFVNEHLTCGICKSLFETPVTLLCQHTFCRECLVEWQRRTATSLLEQFGLSIDASSQDGQLNQLSNKCPVCKTRFFLPPKKMCNTVLQGIIETCVKNRDYTRENLRNSLEDDVRNELRQELLGGVLNELQLVDANIMQPLQPSPPLPSPSYQQNTWVIVIFSALIVRILFIL